MLALYNSEEQLLSQTAGGARRLHGHPHAGRHRQERHPGVLARAGHLRTAGPAGTGRRRPGRHRRGRDDRGRRARVVPGERAVPGVRDPSRRLLRVAGGDPAALEEIGSGAARYGLLLGPELAGLATVGELGVSIGWGLRHADYALALDDSRSGLVRITLDRELRGISARPDLTRALSRPAASPPTSQSASSTPGV